jgi:hypothetical protein
MSDNFPIQNGLKQGDALMPLLFNFALEYAIRKVCTTLPVHCSYWPRGGSNPHSIPFPSFSYKAECYIDTATDQNACFDYEAGGSLCPRNMITPTTTWWNNEKAELTSVINHRGSL